MPRPYEHLLKFVGATHASPCKSQPRMSKQGEACLALYEDLVKSVGATRASPCGDRVHVERRRGMPRPDDAHILSLLC
jgi:hypothetical protein